MNIQITFEIIDGELVAPIQDEIEQVALELEEHDIAFEKAELHRNIFFDLIPLTNNYDVKWSRKIAGWVLQYKQES